MNISQLKLISEKFDDDDDDDDDDNNNNHISGISMGRISKFGWLIHFVEHSICVNSLYLFHKIFEGTYYIKNEHTIPLENNAVASVFIS